MNTRIMILACITLPLLSQPLMAQDAHVVAVEQSMREPAGASVMLNLRVPLGVEQSQEHRATYGLTVGYGMRFDGNRPTEPYNTRRVELAQLNFDSDGARDIQLANYSLTQFGRDDVPSDRLNLSTGNTLLVVGGVVVAVVAIGLLSVDDEDFDFTTE